MCVTNGFCQLIYSLHAMGTRSKIVQYPKSLNNQKKPSLTCCQSRERAAVCWLFRFAFRLCGLIKLWYGFLWQFRRKPYFFLLTRILYKLRYGKYGSCIRKTHFEHGLILGWAVLLSPSTAEWKKGCQLRQYLWGENAVHLFWLF